MGSGEWQKISYVFNVNAVDANFMWVRFYAYGGSNGYTSGTLTNPGGDTSTGIVYWDDLTIEPLAPETVTGTVVDPGTGLGVQGIGVGASAGRNGFAEPQFTTTTNVDGNFTFTLPEAATYSIQAWKPGFAATSTSYDTIANAGGSVTLGAPTAALTNLAAGKPVTAVFTNGSAAENPPSQAITAANDDNLGTRWSSPGTNDFGKLPITVRFDLGDPAPTFDQIALLWEVAKPVDYMIQTSTDGTNWTTVYDADNQGHYFYIPPAATSRREGVVTLSSPVTARYMRIVITGYIRWFNNASLFEAQVGLRPAAPLSGAIRALRIAGGLEAATTTDLAILNAAGGSEIDIADAVALTQQGK